MDVRYRIAGVGRIVLIEELHPVPIYPTRSVHRVSVGWVAFYAGASSAPRPPEQLQITATLIGDPVARPEGAVWRVAVLPEAALPEDVLAAHVLPEVVVGRSAVATRRTRT